MKKGSVEKVSVGKSPKCPSAQDASPQAQVNGVTGLNPYARPYSSSVNFHMGVGPGLIAGNQVHTGSHNEEHDQPQGWNTGAAFPPPGLRLELEKFDGDVIKYLAIPALGLSPSYKMMQRRLRHSG